MGQLDGPTPFRRSSKARMGRPELIPDRRLRLPAAAHQRLCKQQEWVIPAAVSVAFKVDWVLISFSYLFYLKFLKQEAYALSGKRRR